MDYSFYALTDDFPRQEGGREGGREGYCKRGRIGRAKDSIYMEGDTDIFPPSPPPSSIKHNHNNNRGRLKENRVG